MTSFETIINRFLGKVTDDMYMELTEEDTIRDAKQILLDAIPYFEFPRFALYDYNEEQGVYNVDLTAEEINIFALCMKQAWLDRQINSVENTRMKYSGSDFKFTSQANHLAKLLNLKAENHRENMHAQRLYKRRTYGHDGRVMSNWSVLNQSALDGTLNPLQQAINEKVEIPSIVVVTPTKEVEVEVGGEGAWQDVVDNTVPEDNDYYWEPVEENEGS